MRIHPFIFRKRLHGYSPPTTRAHNLARQYSSFRSNNCPTLHSRVITEPNLPTNHSIVFDYNATTNSRLRCDHYPLPDVAVVTNVNHVIDLRPAPNSRPPQSRTVHTSVRSQLHIIFDHDCANLWKLVIARSEEHTSEL